MCESKSLALCDDVTVTRFYLFVSPLINDTDAAGVGGEGKTGSPRAAEGRG